MLLIGGRPHRLLLLIIQLKDILKLDIFHFQVNQLGQYQGPYFPHSSYMPTGPYPVPPVPIESSGICEGILVSLALLLWLYSFYRLYSAWQRVLNFSESSIQGPQGWDLLVNWIMDRIQVGEAKNHHKKISDNFGGEKNWRDENNLAPSFEFLISVGKKRRYS